MNHSGLLHRAAAGKPPATPAHGTVKSRQAERDAIADQIAVYEAAHGPVVTMPIVSRTSISFTYTNLKQKNKLLAEAEKAK